LAKSAGLNYQSAINYFQRIGLPAEEYRLRPPVVHIALSDEAAKREESTANPLPPYKVERDLLPDFFREFDLLGLPKTVAKELFLKGFDSIRTLDEFPDRALLDAVGLKRQDFATLRKHISAFRAYLQEKAPTFVLARSDEHPIPLRRDYVVHELPYYIRHAPEYESAVTPRRRGRPPKIR
jgi:hypothetical protein